jgi:hypothetical protein
VVRERKGLEKGRCRRHRVDRGASIVEKARQCESSGPRSPTDGIIGLDHQYALPMPGQFDSGGQSVGPGTDHDGVIPVVIQ